MEALKKAAKEIAYDNGMINRTNTEEDVVESMVLTAYKHYTKEQLAEVDQYLSGLTEEQFMAVCCEEIDPATPELVEAVLNTMFEYDADEEE